MRDLLTESSLKYKNRAISNKVYSKTLLIILFACVALTGTAPQIMLNFAILIILFLLMLSEDLYLAYPIMLFYYSRLGTIAGISVYRLFSLLFLLVTVLRFNNLPISKRGDVPVLIVYLMYLLFVLADHSLRAAIFSFVNIVCVIFLVAYYLNDIEKLKRFFSIYVVTALIAFGSGLITSNDMNTLQSISGTLVKLTRYMATFEDPNYAGLFYSIAVFAMLSLKLYKPTIRIILLLALYAMILASLSMTAILGNIFFWIVYLFVTKKKGAKVLLIICLAAAILLGMYQYGITHRDAPLLGNLSYRIQDKLMNLQSKDIDSFTTGRLSLTQQHWEYYLQQPAYKILFGGNKVNSIVVDLKGIGPYAAHNEYVDLLLNVGLLGTAIILWFIVRRTFQMIRDYRRTGNPGSLCILMIKCIWLYYALALTMFLEFRFMLFYFI